MKLNPTIKTILSHCKNKFAIATAVFVLWISFLDQNNLLNLMSSRRNLRDMKEQKEYYAKKIESDIQKTKELVSDEENLEKFAREQYLMKNPNEDVFIIVED
jgi:cell division protein FtsB